MELLRKFSSFSGVVRIKSTKVFFCVMKKVSRLSINQVQRVGLKV